MKRTLIPLFALLAAGPPARIRGEDLRQVTAVRCWSLSEATRVVIEDADHAPHLQRPTEVAAAVRSFLD